MNSPRQLWGNQWMGLVTSLHATSCEVLAAP
jgi:hypothetical protein